MCKLAIFLGGVVLAGCSVDGRGLRVGVLDGSTVVVADAEESTRRDLVGADRAFDVVLSASRDVLSEDVLRDGVLAVDVLLADVLLADALSVDVLPVDVSSVEVLFADVRSVDAALVDALREDVPRFDVRREDVLQSSLDDAVVGYSARGVLAYLGVNPCNSGGWDSITGKCYPPLAYKVTSGVCGTTPSCGAHAAGTVLLWDSTLDRYRYLADPSGGTVCLPNDAVYVVSC